MTYKHISAISFNVGNDIYIYDRYSNEFLYIDKITETILDDTFNANFDPAKYEFEPQKVLKRYKEIEKTKADNDVLKPFAIPKLSIAKDKTTFEKVQGKIDGQIPMLVFCTTENCNLRCKYCVYSGNYPTSTRVHNSKKLEWNIAKQAIDFFIEKSKKIEASEKFISFYGGEPLLNFEIIRLTVDYIKRREIDVKFTITTNLTLANDEIINFLIDNNFMITVSIDGPECIHDTYRMSKNETKTHSIILQNLHKIKNIDFDYFKNKIYINVAIVPHRYDLDTLDNYFNSDIFKDVEIEHIKPLQINNEENTFFSHYDYFGFIKNFNEHTLNKFIAAHKAKKTDFSDMKISYQYYIRGIKQIYFSETNRLNEYDYYWPNGICIPGFRSIFVSTDGQYYPCEKMNIRSLNSYKIFIELNYYPQKITAIEERITQYQQQCQNLKRQQTIAEEQHVIARKSYSRDSLLFQQKVISQEETEKSKNNYLQNRLSLENSHVTLKNLQIQISQLREMLLDTKQEYANNKNQLELELNTLMGLLLNEINTWEINFALISPINGKITFTGYWIENQNVTMGETVFSVIPLQKTDLIGKAQLPIARSGKVKKGQQVNIHFLNYPDNEFGMVRGIVSNISLVPVNDYYALEISFPKGLQTTYKKDLPFSQEMTANIEIITEDMRLIERFILPLKRIWKERI